MAKSNVRCITFIVYGCFHFCRGVTEGVQRKVVEKAIRVFSFSCMNPNEFLGMCSCFYSHVLKGGLAVILRRRGNTWEVHEPLNQRPVDYSKIANSIPLL